MTKKKQRVKFARTLRRHGINGARGFQVARAVVKAGCPANLSAATCAGLGLEVLTGGWCPNRGKWNPTIVFCLSSGGSVSEAWYAFNRG